MNFDPSGKSTLAVAAIAQSGTSWHRMAGGLQTP